MIAKFDLLTCCLYFDLTHKDIKVFNEILRYYFTHKKAIVEPKMLLEFAKIRISNRGVTLSFKHLLNKNLLRRVTVSSNLRVYEVNFEFMIMALKDVRLQTLITDIKNLNEHLVKKMYNLYMPDSC